VLVATGFHEFSMLLIHQFHPSIMVCWYLLLSMCPDSVTYRKKGPYLSSIHPSIPPTPLSLSRCAGGCCFTLASKEVRTSGGPGEEARDGFFQTKVKRVIIGAQIWTEEKNIGIIAWKNIEIITKL
jgi:hypothetical protein